MIWSYSPEKRLVIWRNFRKSLENQSLYDAAKLVAAWWTNIPVASGFSTPWATDIWPDPWSLLSSQDILDHTHTSVAMAYTLWLTVGEDKEKVELAVINDRAKRQILLVVLVDKTHMINYNTGDLVDIRQLVEDVEILSSYGYSAFKSRIKA